jgi:two-component system chemotaxis response regulator CheY
LHSLINASALVVDDDPVMIDLVSKILSNSGFEKIDRASDGKAAEVMARAGDYGLIVSDLYMEPTGGLDLLRALQADERLRNAPFLLMTGSVGASVAASLSGADGYIMKPFTPEQFREKLFALLGKRATQVR